MDWGPPEDDPEDPGAGAGGWVPPEARSWRHPSELHAARVAAVLTAAHGWRRGAAVAVGTAALLAIAAGALLLASTGSSSDAPTLDTMADGTAAVTPCCSLSPVLTRDAEAEVVSIEPSSAGPGETGCGVVVGNGLVATTEAALAGAKRVRVVAATGRLLDGDLIAEDGVTGIVLLRLSGSLPAARMEAGDTPGTGTSVLAVAMQPAAGRRSPKPLWTSATVVSVGEPTPATRSTSMAEITVRGSSVPVMPGEALVDTHGRVEGILDGASGSERSFLPISLVVGVSNDLETMGTVRHGWLGITDTTPDGSTGAKVLWVDPQGASGSMLRAGDVIVRVDGWRVHSAADLRSMLYLMAPGTRISVEAMRGTRLVRTVVELATSP